MRDKKSELTDKKEDAEKWENKNNKKEKEKVPFNCQNDLRFQMRSRCNAASDKMIEDCLGAPAASNEIAHFTRGQTSWQAISFGNCVGPTCSYFSPPAT